MSDDTMFFCGLRLHRVSAFSWADGHTTVTMSPSDVRAILQLRADGVDVRITAAAPNRTDCERQFAAKLGKIVDTLGEYRDLAVAGIQAVGSQPKNRMFSFVWPAQETDRVVNYLFDWKKDKDFHENIEKHLQHILEYTRAPHELSNLLSSLLAHYSEEKQLPEYDQIQVHVSHSSGQNQITLYPKCLEHARDQIQLTRRGRTTIAILHLSPDHRNCIEAEAPNSLDALVRLGAIFRQRFV